nr:MAG TPA: hypothetical protein [Caudoviricetes sp.]
MSSSEPGFVLTEKINFVANKAAAPRTIPAPVIIFAASGSFFLGDVLSFIILSSHG